MIGGGNPRAALVAMVAATGPGEAGQALCAALLDAAGDLLTSAPAEILIAAGGSADAVNRLEGVALLSEICGACRLCVRGQALAEDQPGPRAPPSALGPIGRQRWRPPRA